MKWESFSAFISMGGYGLYVWGSYLVSAVVLAVEAWSLVARHRRARRALQPPRED
jgi:heme exporter protein D